MSVLIHLVTFFIDVATSTSIRRRGGRQVHERLGRRGRLRLALAATLLAAVGFRFWLTTANVSPWIMVDELIFSDQAKSVAQHANLDVRDQHFGVFSLLYPVLIAPAWLISSGKDAYEIAKALNSVLVTLGAVPLYLWSRRLLPANDSVFVCFLVGLMPPLILAGNLMSDNAFFPAFLCATFSIALALERPTLLRQTLAFGAVAVACTIRLQGLVLLLVFPSAVLLHALLEPGPTPVRARLAQLWRSARAFLPSLLAFLSAAAIYTFVVLAVGARWSSALGGYQVTTQVGYSAADAARWIAYQFGELEIASGFLAIPAALALLLWALRRRSDTSPAERAFLAVTASSVFWLVIQTGVFASRFADRVEERLMFYVVPLLLLALVLWLWRQPPQPALAKLVAFGIPAAFGLALPLKRLLTPAIYSDTFGLIPFASLLGFMSVTSVREIVVGAIAIAGVLFIIGRGAFVQVVAPIALAGFLAVSSVTAARNMSRASRAERATAQVGNELTWIDGAVGTGARVGFLLTPEVDPRALWQLEFWNQAVRRVFVLGQREPGGLPDTPVAIDPASGRLDGSGTRARPAYLVAPRTYVAGGRVVARQGYWVLYRAQGPLRLTSRVQGVASDGWVGNHASDSVYRSGSGSSTMTVLISRAAWGGADLPSPVRIEARSIGSGKLLAKRTWVVHSLGTRTFYLGTLQEPYRVSVFVKRTFSPADFGLADQRQLGAQVAFSLGRP
jgi:hypothetical protein